MTWIQNVTNALEAGLWKFVRIIHSANHEYPYHDFVCLTAGETEGSYVLHYTVGEGNVGAHGDQHKYFVSKRMIIWTYSSGVTVKLNHADNVAITMPLSVYDSTDQVHMEKLELRTNISEVFILCSEEAVTYIYCEGVLPQEARDAE